MRTAKKDEVMNTEFGTFRRSHRDENGSGSRASFSSPYVLHPASSCMPLKSEVELTFFVLEDVEMLLVNHHATVAGLVGVAEKWKEGSYIM